MAKSMDAIEHARRGDISYFKEVDIHILQNSRNDNGGSVLMEAAMENHLECCKEIYRRSPSLIYHKDTQGTTVLHGAAWKGRSEIVEFLLNADAYINSGDGVASGIGEEKVPNKKLLLMVNAGGGTALHVSVYNRQAEATRILIQADPSYELLSIVENTRKTALHYAVEYQILEMVKLLTDPNPDIEYHADDSGHTPLTSAVALARQLKNSNSVKIRKLLIEKQVSQINSPIIHLAGQSLIHLAASQGDLDLMEEILEARGFDCLKWVDNDGANAVHYAASNGDVKVLKHILNIKELPDNVLNAQNNYGNTPLHISAIVGNPGTTLCLLYDYRVKKTITNLTGKRAVDLITIEYNKDRAGVYDVRDVVNEKELKDQSEFDLVVCALIATISFTAGIMVPGGYISEGPNQGMAVLSKKIAFQAFIVTNTWALLLSLSAVFCHFCTRIMRKKKDIDFLVTMATYCTLGAIFTMVITFITGSYAVLAITKGLAITVCVSSSTFFLLAFYAIAKMAMQYQKRNGGGPSTNNRIHGA